MDIVSLAKKCAYEGIQPTKDEIMAMSNKDLYDFTYRTEKFKQQKERELTRENVLAQFYNAIKSNQNILIQASKVWTFTPHAIKRLLERGPSDCIDLLDLLKRDLTDPIPGRFSKRNSKAYQMMTHRFEHTEYYFGKLTGLVYVVTTNNTIKTVHKNESKRWKRTK